MLALLKGIYRIFRCIREFVISLFFILFVLICFAVVTLLSQDPSTTPNKTFQKGALMLNLDGYLADNHDEFSDFHRFLQSEFGSESEPLKISTFDVVRAINQAKYDDNITGLVLDLSFFDGGDLPSLNFVGKEILAFKESKKPVIAVGEYYSQQQYYLASFADKIYLNQAGFVDLHGLSYNTLYFKSLLDKIEAVPHIFRVGTYKSAVEPFLRDDMSPEARQNAQGWLNDLWRNFTQDIAHNRQTAAETLIPSAQRYIELYRNAQGDDARYALNQKLVTEIATTEQIRQALIEQFGKDRDGHYNHINFFDYSTTLADRFNVNSTDKIAVINVEGEIIWGESDESSAGSDTLIRLLRAAREDSQVRGTILRINSPGGSAMASELIRQEVEALQKAGKPVVASMGGMAASGGYWIASTSDKIIAGPSTITGSIGIFGLALSFEQTAKNLGVKEDGVTTSPLAGSSALKTLSQEQAEIIQISIEHGYDRFLELVSLGRKMSKDAVDKVAQGQVWTGETALAKGLVDELGDFNDAYGSLLTLINQQRKTENQTEFEHLDVQWFIETQDDFISQVMRDFQMKFNLQLTSLFGQPISQKLTKQMDLLTKFNDPKQTYLYCLNCGSVK